MTYSGYDQIKQEQNNLRDFIIELYDDKNVGLNIRLIRECLLEWHNTQKIIT